MYLLFAFYNYYPEGGWNDYQGNFDSLDEATAVGNHLLEERDADEYQIVGLLTRKVVASRKRD